MKTIEDAVIELNGKLPNKTCNKRCSDGGWYISLYGKLAHVVDCVWFELDDFEATAKRMGYINGYRYGVEYPTNGKKPDLPDDLRVCVKFQGQWLDSSHEYDDVRSCNWIAGESFKIIDPRYKPAEPEQKAAADSASVKCGCVGCTNTATHTWSGHPTCDDCGSPSRLKPAPAPAKPWFEAGELPAIGCFVDVVGFVVYGIGEKDCEVVAHVENCAVIRMSYGLGCFQAECLKPSMTDKEKALDAADLAIHQYSAGADIRTELLGALYDAGLLRLPDQK